MHSRRQVLGAEIGPEGDAQNISKRVPGDVRVSVLRIRLFNFTVNSVCLSANTDGCGAEGPACLLQTSTLDGEMSHTRDLISIRLLTSH